MQVNYKTPKTAGKLYRTHKEKIITGLILLPMFVFIWYSQTYFQSQKSDLRTRAQTPSSTPKIYGITVKAKVLGENQYLSCIIKSDNLNFAGQTPYSRYSLNPFKAVLTAPAHCQGLKFAKWSDDSTSLNIAVNDTQADNFSNTYLAFYK